MIGGIVTEDGSPTVFLTVAGQSWPAVVDTGFNGDLELPEELRPHVNPRYHAEAVSLLAGGQSVVEDIYLVDFSFDDETVCAEASFSSSREILLGTHLLRQYDLRVHFPNRTVRLERVP
jgi:predicted aspartyl protease